METADNAPRDTENAPLDDQQWIVDPGTDVVDSEGRHVGRVDDIRDGYLIVRKGRFFGAGYFIPFGAIASHDATTIYLGVAADDEATRLWHQQPAATQREGVAGSGPNAMDDEERLEYLTDREGNVRVPVIREELAATTRPVVRGSVRVETLITEHEETLEVPVTEERVRIERRRFDRDATGADVVVDGDTFEVPFYGQEADFEQRVRVIEEIIIIREAVETVRRVHGTVRREDVRFDEADVPADNVDPRDLTTGAAAPGTTAQGTAAQDAVDQDASRSERPDTV